MRKTANMMVNVPKPEKPLGHKAYGSIPHLPGSRTCPSDLLCNQGQAFICTQKARDKHDRIIVQVKEDGSCCSVARIGDEIVALVRSGYRANSSPYEQHHLFHDWVEANRQRFLDLLSPGERVVGEWLAQAHGTRYRIDDFEPFVPFDIMRGYDRILSDELVRRCDGVCLTFPVMVHGGCPISVGAAMAKLEAILKGFDGAIDPPEGLIYRVERHGKVDFMAKWVRPDKVDGCYLPEKSGKEPVWNWHPNQSLIWHRQ